MKSIIVFDFLSFFSNDLLFCVSQKYGKPKNVFINTQLLDNLDKNYQNMFIGTLKLKNSSLHMYYERASLKSIQEKINFIIVNLRDISRQKKVSLNHFNEFMSHVKTLNSQISRFEKEFDLKIPQRIYFLRAA